MHISIMKLQALEESAAGKFGLFVLGGTIDL